MVLGIIGAMEVEVAHLKETMTVLEKVERAGLEFYKGRLEGLDVVVVRCGIGKVNASLCTQILIDLFDVDAILNTGVAGSLDNTLEVGDLVISTDCVHHDVDVTILGYKPGQIPDLEYRFFEADERLQKAVVKAAMDNDLDCGTIGGRICSGDQFVASTDEKKRIIDTFGGACCEMEGASIAHVATVNHVPFVIVRAISDKADGSAMVSYPEFEKAAAYHCATIVQGVAANLAK